MPVISVISLTLKSAITSIMIVMDKMMESQIYVVKDMNALMENVLKAVCKENVQVVKCV